MNPTLIRFEAQRFTRRPRVWLLFLGLVLITVSLFEGDFALRSIIHMMIMGFFVGIMASSRGQDDPRIVGVGAESQYLLSRAGTRTQILVSRWIFYAVVTGALWSALMIGLAVRGKLSSQDEGRVGWNVVAVLEAKGHQAVFSPRDRQTYSRWIADGQPSTRRMVNVELPWVAPTALTLTFLAFWLGAVGRGLAGPSRTRRRRRIPWTSAAMAGTVVWGFFVIVISPGLTTWISASLYLHFGIAAALAVALVTLLVTLSIRTWRYADF